MITKANIAMAVASENPLAKVILCEAKDLMAIGLRMRVNIVM
jgi:hypothetical protein